MSLKINPAVLLLLVVILTGCTKVKTVELSNVLPDPVHNRPPLAISCNPGNRPLINARLVPLGHLSGARANIAIATAENKILFAGGNSNSRVDIYDITANLWATAELSQVGGDFTTAVLGSKIFFAGGNQSSRVDIYDAATNAWSRSELSIGRSCIAGAAAGNTVVFAGGIGQGFFSPHWPTSPVDIYNASTNTWSTGFLDNRPTVDNIGVAGMATTVIGSKMYFAGNASDWFAWDFGNITSTINIYDASTNTWSTSELSLARGFMASIAVGNKNYWAGGLYRQPGDPFTNLVEIRDMSTGLSTHDSLFQPNAFFSAVLKNNKIVFFTSRVNLPNYFHTCLPVMNKFDIYDLSTNTWSIGVLPIDIYGSAIISVNDIIYVAGGYINGQLSDKVWKLEF